MAFSPIATLIISAVYYSLAAAMTFFSAFGVYVLIRYGEKRALALVISLLYSFFFLSILAQSYAGLRSII